MKTIVKCLFISLLSLLTCFCSKTDDKSDPTPIPEPEPEQTVDSIIIPSTEDTSPTFTSEGGSSNISFTSSGSWTASIINGADSWCTISPKEGKSGAGKISISTAKNDTYDDRNASVQLKCGIATKTIAVTQKQKDAIIVSKSSYDVAAQGGVIAIEVKSNISFSYNIEDDAKNWISLSDTKSLSTHNLSFKVAANEDVNKREGIITIYGGDIKTSVTICQEESPISPNLYSENGVEYGIGIEVNENINGSTKTVIWAPVNCGQKAPDSTSTNGYGMMYQWGYGTSDSNAHAGIHEGNGNYLRKSFKAGSTVSSTSWPSEVGISDYDKWCNDSGPCPSGWRLPTTAELEGLVQHNVWAQGPVGEVTVTGYWCNGSGSATEGKGVFLPTSGEIICQSKKCAVRGKTGLYWSSDCNTGMRIWAYRLEITQTFYEMETSYRAWGFSVRCVKQ